MAECTEELGAEGENGGILGVGVGIVGILGRGHKPHMRWARIHPE